MKKLLFPLGALATLLVGAPTRADARVVFASGLPGFAVVAAPPPPPVTYYGYPAYQPFYRYPSPVWRHGGRHRGWWAHRRWHDCDD